MDRIPVTVNGVKMLRDELDWLKNNERAAVIQAIAEARAHGDLKENAEYHAAKEKQGFIEARIRDLEAKLNHVQVIDVTELDANGRVVFGTTVELFNLTDRIDIRYQIVGEDEANIEQSKISFNSPIAKALMGKEEGDTVIIRVPKGDVSYEILAVHYLP